jgi:hypothetical protein
MRLSETFRSDNVYCIEARDACGDAPGSRKQVKREGVKRDKGGFPSRFTCHRLPGGRRRSGTAEIDESAFQLATPGNGYTISHIPDRFFEEAL